jgi:predicted sugar kinase
MWLAKLAMRTCSMPSHASRRRARGIAAAHIRRGTLSASGVAALNMTTLPVDTGSQSSGSRAGSTLALHPRYVTMRHGPRSRPSSALLLRHPAYCRKPVPDRAVAIAILLPRDENR